MKTTIARFEDTERPALVKMPIEGKPELVLLAFKKGVERAWPAFVFSSFKFVDLTGPHGPLMRYEHLGVLSFGSEFEIKPDYAGQIELDDGALFNVPGALVQHRNGTYIVFEGENGTRCLSLEERWVTDTRGAPRAAFGSWSMYLPGEEQPIFTHKSEPAART